MELYIIQWIECCYQDLCRNACGYFLSYPSVLNGHKESGMVILFNQRAPPYKALSTASLETNFHEC